MALILLAGDWITLAASLLAVWAIRGFVLPMAVPGLPALFSLSLYYDGLFWFAPWLVAMAAARLYGRHAGFWEEVRAIVRATTWGTVLAVVLSFTVKADYQISRLLMGSFWLVSMPALCATRYWLKRLLARSGLWRRSLLVVGDGSTAVNIARGLRDDPTLGFVPVGFVGAQATEPEVPTLDGLAVHSPWACIPGLLRDQGIRDVVIALPPEHRHELAHLIALCEGQIDSLRIVPEAAGLASTEVEAETIGGQLLIGMRSNLARPSNLAIKRASDMIGAALLLVPAVPLLAILALLVRLDSKGPAFFVQQRVGRRGKPFPCYKFRTMHLDAEERLARHLEASPEARAEWEAFKKLKSGDPRVTRVGRVLRRLSLDELPQLANVLRGEMSLVGPRPYLAPELVGHEDVFRTILMTWPGITGLWQVSGRNELTMAERLQLDEYYVRNWSLWLDLEIFIRTFGALARSEGAY